MAFRLNVVQPGQTYHYRVLAAPAAQTEDTIEWEAPTVSGADQSFTTLASPPSILGESASNIKSTDAALEAQINPNSLQRGAYYQFQVVADAGEYLPEFACPTEGFPANTSLCPGLDFQQGALPISSTPAAEQVQSVSLDLTSASLTLQPGTTYHYRVIAARKVQSEDTIEWEAPTVYGADQTFTTAPDPAPSISQPSAAEGQLPEIQSPPSATPSHRSRHHRRKHKRRQHRANLDRGNRAG